MTLPFFFATALSDLRADDAPDLTRTPPAELREGASYDGIAHDGDARDGVSHDGVAHDVASRPTAPHLAPAPAASRPDATTSAEAAREADLLERARNGDLDAFDGLVALHQTKIYHLCLWMIGDAEDAADAAQTTFVRAFRALPKFRGEAKIGTWLHRIAANVALDVCNRRKRAPRPFSQMVADDDEGGENPIERVADTTSATDPAERLARRERQGIVRAALSRLPPNHRAVITLFDIEGRSYEEASAILGVPMGTVKSRLNRARDALRRELEPHRELWEA